MSIILDALKKSESDQQRQSGPALFEVRVAEPKARLPVWAMAIVGLLVINILIVGFMLLRRSAHGDDSASNTSNPAAMSAGGAQYAANGQGPMSGANGRTPQDRGNNWANAGGGNWQGQGGGGGSNNGPGGSGGYPNGGSGQGGDANGASGPGGWSQARGGNGNWSQGGGNTNWQAQQGNANWQGAQGGGPNWAATQGAAYGPGAPGGGANGGGAANGSGPYGGAGESNGPGAYGPAQSNGPGPYRNNGESNGSGTPGAGPYSPGQSNGQATSGSGAAGNPNAERVQSEPTLMNRAREAAAAESAAPANGPANPDDYAPATEPENSLFKGHVKRGTESGVPLYQDLAVVPGANLPQLRLDLHVYAAKPQDRFALINMHKMHEGETTADGVRVEAITPDGVIMSHNGSKFLLPRD